MANSAPSAKGFMVVTHVHQQQGAQNGTVLATSSPLMKFLKGEPAVLGTVQIMIGVIMFMFGVVTSFNIATISSYSGIRFLGAIIFITAGSLTVRASKNLNVCLVKASLGMNIVSTIIAGTAISLHALDVMYQLISLKCDSSSDNCYEAVTMYRSREVGIVGVMIVLSLLEFIISICVSVFACKATCCSLSKTPEQI